MEIEFVYCHPQTGEQWILQKLGLLDGLQTAFQQKTPLGLMNIGTLVK